MEDISLYVMSRVWRVYKNIIILLSMPILLLPIALVGRTKAAFCVYIHLITITFYATEALPGVLVALLPIILGPALKLQTSKKTCNNYGVDAVFYFIGIDKLRVCMEAWNFYDRLSLYFLKISGTHFPRILLIVMAQAFFTSLIFGHIVTITLGMPLIKSVTDLLHAMTKIQSSDPKSDTKQDIESGKTHSEPSFVLQRGPAGKKQVKMFRKVLTLSLAYSSTCSRFCVWDGETYKMFRDFIHSRYGINVIDAFTWFWFAMPISLLHMVFIWFWIQIFFFRRKNFFRVDRNFEQEAKIKKKLDSMLKALKRCSSAEWSLIGFSIAALVFKISDIFLGSYTWRNWLLAEKKEKNMVSRLTPLILLSILLHVWPTRNPFKMDGGSSRVVTLMDGQGGKNKIAGNISWNNIYILGSMSAMQSLFADTGLSQWWQMHVRHLAIFPIEGLILSTIIIASTASEFLIHAEVSNILFGPIETVAKCISVNPFILIIPIDAAQALTFCLPIASIPNALVFGSGKFSMIEMFMSGLLIKFFSIIFILIGTLTWGNFLFSLKSYPSWLGVCKESIWD